MDGGNLPVYTIHLTWSKSLEVRIKASRVKLDSSLELTAALSRSLWEKDL